MFKNEIKIYSVLSFRLNRENKGKNLKLRNSKLLF